MGTEIALYSSLVSHSIFPVRESKARKRLSLVAPMKTKPPAVTMGPPKPMRPVLRLPSGSSSVTPRGTCQANSPVLAFTAVRRPHGGFWQGQLLAPITRPDASVFLAQNFELKGLPSALA